MVVSYLVWHIPYASDPTPSFEMIPLCPDLKIVTYKSKPLFHLGSFRSRENFRRRLASRLEAFAWQLRELIKSSSLT
jgi:hypothetical protein